MCHNSLQTSKLNLEHEAFKDITFVEPGFKAVPPKVDLNFFKGGLLMMGGGFYPTNAAQSL